MSSPTISLVINTKNEAKHIAECIASARHFVNEIIVVDMHSEDDTIKRARKAGAKTFLAKDVGYVEPARNFAIQKAKSTWVLLLDADERLTSALGERLTEIAKQKQADAVWISRKNIRLGKWMQHGGFWPDQQMRFFKKSAVQWPTQIHQHPTIKGKQLHLPSEEPLAIVHYNIEHSQQIFDKIDAFTQHEQYFANLGTVSVDQLFHILDYEFSQRFFIQEGYKDGIHGFVFAKSMEYYRFVEFVRYWEQQGCPEFFTGEEIRQAFNQSERLKRLQTELTEIKDSKFYPLFTWYTTLKSLLKK